MAIVYSGPGWIRVRGRVALKVAKIVFKVMSGNTDVDLLLEGHDGHSRGPVKIQVSVEGAIPQAGPDIDYAGICAAGAVLPVDFVLAGQTRICEGDLRDYSDTTATTGNGFSFEYHGKWLNPPATA